MKQRLPTVDAWNLTVQRELTKTISVEIAYVGNKGTHVFCGNNPDCEGNQPTLAGFRGTAPIGLTLVSMKRPDTARGPC